MKPGQLKGWGVRWCDPDQWAITIPKDSSSTAVWTALYTLHTEASGHPARLKMTFILQKWADSWLYEEKNIKSHPMENYNWNIPILIKI